MRHSAILFSMLAAGVLCAAEFPEAEISSRSITAKFYLPDAQKGYYRATRFDWSGQIYSLRAGGHEYFGQWFPKYDPKLHDSIMGPVEEFRAEDDGPGYAEARPGGTFLRIGVGAVRKVEEPGMQHFKTYDIVDPGKWTVDRKSDQIRFTHVIKGENGYAYRYTKTVRLDKDKPVMTIEHTLENTGTKAIRTAQYNHNFFMIDHLPTGPDSVMLFPFDIEHVTPLRGPGAETRGHNVVYSRELETGESVSGDFAGYGKTAADFDFHVENKRAGAGVEVTGDLPLVKIIYWSIRTTLCPEGYVDIHVEPGKKLSWSYKYRFYALAAR